VHCNKQVVLYYAIAITWRAKGRHRGYIAWMKSSALIQAHVFSGHESFPIRFTWLTKAVRYCEPTDQRDLFSRPDAMVTLGVGKNMVRSMRSWAVATGMLEPEGNTSRSTHLRPTELGVLFFGKDGVDPFMEDPATIWLLHWFLASNPRIATWFWTFNELHDTEFERGQLVKRLLRASREISEREIAEDTIERDVDCFLRTYVPSDPDKRLSREELLDCPLTELGLIRRSGGHDAFKFIRGRHDSLPDEIFAYCLLAFWDRRLTNSESLRFDDVAYARGSPGQIFKLTENSLVDRLHQLGRLTGNRVRYDDTSGLRQIFREKRIEPMVLLRKHYGINGRESTHATAR
jgi:hypothetical protein